MNRHERRAQEARARKAERKPQRHVRTKTLSGKKLAEPVITQK